MKLIQSILTGGRHYRNSLTKLNRTYCTASAPVPVESFNKKDRSYAGNLTEYNHVLNSLSNQRKFFLMRDAYDDMVLDGIQPSRDTFHSLIGGMFKGGRVQDALFFKDEMKTLGMTPDVALYNFLIATCGKSKNGNLAIRFLDEMRINGVKPNGQTYICLLNALAASCQIDKVYAIVRDMTAAGLGLNKFCYAGLITAHKNKTPTTDETTSKIIELVEKSKGWSEASSDSAENVMLGVSEEELYGLPTAPFVQRRGFPLNKQLTVYHSALHAAADLRSMETTETLLEMLKRENTSSDTFIEVQALRCYLNSGDLDRAVRVFEEFINLRPPPMSVAELYATLIEGAMIGYTAPGMKLADEKLVEMDSKGFFLLPRMINELLLVASGEKTGGYTTANIIWDLMQKRNVFPSLEAVEAYYRGLKEREVPKDDPRLLVVQQSINNSRRPRYGN